MASVTVTSTPVDLVADQSLSAGTYRCQNLGPGTVRMLPSDAAVTPLNQYIGGYRLPPGGWYDLTTDGSDFLYAYTESLLIDIKAVLEYQNTI